MKNYLKTFFVIALTIGLTVVNCASPARYHNVKVRDNEKENIRKVNSVFLRQFVCQDTIISRVVKNLIIQEFLPTKIKITNDSLADVKIDITISLASDMAGGGNAIATRGIGSASFTNSAGGYVSGITAQIIRSENIIASVTVSQSRTNSGIPDPPERIADDLANRIVCVFTRGWCDYY